MIDIKQIHRQAVELAKKANEALQYKRIEEYNQFAQAAFELEKKAALELIRDFDAEPTRSVLFRSAATIANNIGKFNEAKQLIHLGLSGTPYLELKDELEMLLKKVEEAITAKLPIPEAIENAYMELLKTNAINLKIEPKEKRYSKAIVVDYIIDFLKNIQSAYSNFSEVNFRKNFFLDDDQNFDTLLKNFKHESKTLCVDLQFQSFGVSIVADTAVMNHNELVSEKFKEFKTSLFEDFKKEVLLPDLNSKTFQKEIKAKYTPEEITQIFSPVIESLKAKSKYRVSIADKGFKRVIKICPSVNNKSELVYKPIIQVQHQNDAIISLQRTFETVNPLGKKSKLLSENLDYAEFKWHIQNISYSSKTAYFRFSHDVKIIFNHGIFLIDDDYYKIYLEEKDYSKIQRKYGQELIEKFSFLLEKESKTIDEFDILEAMKSNIIKGW